MFSLDGLLSYLQSIDKKIIENAIKENTNIVEKYKEFIRIAIKPEEVENLKKISVGEVIEKIKSKDKELGEKIEKEGKEWLENNLESLKNL